MKIGIDIQDTKRMKTIIGTSKMARIFSERELEYLESKNFALQSVAGLYCAKEAYFKALGTGIAHSKLNSVEVLHDERGAPYLEVNSEKCEADKITLSISHTQGIAVAVCVVS